jgi:GNAT superfamily N-acetyltransferase
MSDGARFEDAYRVRWYDPGDREAFLSLYGEAFGGGSDEWFAWKYLENPRTSHVPILVAESEDGEFAGARPQVPFLMRAGDDTGLVLRFGDTMVHPDHRRRGVFSSLTERALEHYGRMPPRLCFNCPNHLSRPGFLDAGGTLVTELTSFYRVQNPEAYLDVPDTAGALVGAVGRAATRGYHRLRRATASAPDDVTVVRHDGVPVELLASLYERGVPRRIHAVRDERFLRWRYGNPQWEYAVHSARDGGRTVAALVTGRGRQGGNDVTAIVDALPLTGGETRRRGLRALLAAVLPRHADADVVAYSGRSIPREVLSSFGFLDDASAPLSWPASQSTLLAYDLTDESEPSWSLGGVDAREADGWSLSFTELDAH